MQPLLRLTADREQVNGCIKKDGSTRNMIYTISQLIAFTSAIFRLQPGDIIMTGTPKGVSEIAAGDKISASIRYEDGKVLDHLEKEVVVREGGYRFDQHWTTWI
jgi:acylpyruvate hydrolase